MASAELANKVVVFTDPKRVMGHNGKPKEYSLHLDGEAATIVSETVWDRLQAVMAVHPELPRFTAVGRIERPPTQVSGGAAKSQPGVMFMPDGARVELGDRPIPTLVHG
jgi:hypothetical protein